MKPKLLMIGVDGIEPMLVNDLMAKGNSRGFATLSRDGGSKIELNSTFPPDTSLAWPSIYTGLNPYRLRLSDCSSSQVDTQAHIRRQLKGRTFWDYLTKADLSSCIINAVPIFPSWRIKGAMITSHEDTVSVFPRSLSERYRFPTMSYAENYPAAPGEYPKRYAKVTNDTLELSRFSSKMLSEGDYDLFFVCFSTLDHAQHCLWRFADPGDPARPLVNLYGDYIMRLYQTFDYIVKSLIDRFGDEYTIAVLGDHGHGRRPWKLFSLNELLRRSGFLKLSNMSRINQIRSLTKALALEFSYYSRTDWIAYKVYSKLTRRSSGMTLANIPTSVSVATRGSFGKQFGGIFVNECSLEKRKKLIDVVFDFVSRLAIVESVVKTSDICWGLDDPSQPDLLVKLKDEYGFQHGLYIPLVQKNFEKRIISGGHMSKTLMMLWPGPNEIKIGEARNYIVEDIAPSVLSHFGMKIPPNLDGTSIWRST